MIGDFRFSEFEHMIHRKVDIIARAAQLGTLDSDDRSRQYTTPENPELLRSLNEAWTKIRQLQKAGDKKDTAILALQKKLRRSQVVNIALTSIVTGLAWEGLKALIAVMR